MNENDYKNARLKDDVWFTCRCHWLGILKFHGKHELVLTLMAATHLTTKSHPIFQSGIFTVIFIHHYHLCYISARFLLSKSPTGKHLFFQTVQLCNWTFSWKHEAPDATSDDRCHFKRDVGRFLGCFTLISLKKYAFTAVSANITLIEWYTFNTVVMH